MCLSNGGVTLRNGRWAHTEERLPGTQKPLLTVTSGRGTTRSEARAVTAGGLRPFGRIVV